MTAFPVEAGPFLHWGAGPAVARGWVNSDRTHYPGMDHVGDLLRGLPWPGSTFGLVVSHHALQMLERADVVPALLELRRVTRPGAWIRLSVPDLEKALAALELERVDEPTFLRRLFPDALGTGDRLNRYLTHYAQRTYWTAEYAAEVLEAAGWSVPAPLVAGRSLDVGETMSPWAPTIVELDGRPDESLFMEATRR